LLENDDKIKGKKWKAGLLQAIEGFADDLDGLTSFSEAQIRSKLKQQKEGNVNLLISALRVKYPEWDPPTPGATPSQPQRPPEKDDTNLIPTEASQRSASAFASSNKSAAIKGAGLCFSSDWRERPSAEIFAEHFGDVAVQAEDVTKVSDMLLSCIIDTANLKQVGETGRSNNSRSVQDDHVEIIASYFKDTFKTGKLKLWQKQQNGTGIATHGSEPHGHLMTSFRINGNISKVPAGVIDAKGMAAGAIDALPQAFAFATNVMMEWLRLGMPWNEVKVPVWTTTGQLMKFGVARLLEPAFPYFVPMSPTLDLTTPSGREEAATLLLKINEWCATEKVATIAQQEEPLQMRLDTTLYYLKPMEHFFCVYPDQDKSLQHMLRVLQKVMTSNAARPNVVAPITIRTADNRMHDALVFHDFVKQGFTIGLPADREQRKLYLQALREAADAVHRAGVVHLDLCPSNVLWKLVDGRIIIKIIDWDVAHSVNEPLAPKALERINNHRLTYRRKMAGLQGDASTAITEFDTSVLALLRRVADDPVFHTTNKGALDDAFEDAGRKATMNAQ